MIAISARCFPQQWGKILSARKPDPYLAPPWLRTQPRFHIALEHSQASTQPVPALLSQCWIFHLYWVHLEPSLNCAFCFNKHIILNSSSLPLHFLAKHSFKWLNHRAFPQIFVHEVMLKILISKQVDLGELKQKFVEAFPQFIPKFPLLSWGCQLYPLDSVEALVFPPQRPEFLVLRIIKEQISGVSALHSVWRNLAVL